MFWRPKKESSQSQQLARVDELREVIRYAQVKLVSSLARSTVARELIVYEALGLEVFSLKRLQRAQIKAFLVQEIANALDAIELRRLGVRFPKELGRRLQWDDDSWADKYGLQEFFNTFLFRWSNFLDVLEELDLARMNVHYGVQFSMFAVGLPGHTSNFPADVCMMALLALLATLSTVHQVASYMGITSNSVDECNHFTGDFLQENFEQLMELIVSKSLLAKTTSSSWS